MKLILITTPYYFVQEDKILTALFEEGLEALHLRKPNSSPILAERLLTLIPERFHNRIVVHENFHLHHERFLKGVHLNRRHPELPSNHRGHISTSCHSFEEVIAKKSSCNYLFLSPIFDSISKEDYQSPYTPEEILMAKKKGVIDKKVIALGGVDESNLQKIKEYGFGGAAILGTLWNKFDPHTDRSYRSIIEHFKYLKKVAG
ncbi:MAG: thiamine phosphate synthase [Phocaeicola sp.]